MTNLMLGAGTAALLLSGCAGGSSSSEAPTPVVETTVSAASTPTSSATPSPSLPPGAIGIDENGLPVYSADTDPAEVDYSQATEENGDPRLWVTQQVITAQCMREKGFEYTFKASWLRQLDDREPAQFPIGTEGHRALYGDQSAEEDYDWTRAGCVGYAVHLTGQDDAN